MQIPYYFSLNFPALSNCILKVDTRQYTHLLPLVIYESAARTKQITEKHKVHNITDRTNAVQSKRLPG